MRALRSFSTDPIKGISTTAQITRKMVLTAAMLTGLMTMLLSAKPKMASEMYQTAAQTMAPMVCITRYDQAVRRPGVRAPRAESRTGTAAPMLMPRMRGKASTKRMAPVTDRACRIPTAAEALCSTAVKAAPTRMPSRGLEKAVIKRMKAGLSLRGATAPLMACMPNIKTAKPSRMSPTWRWACFLENMRRMMPMTATIALMEEVDSSDTSPPLPCT